MTLVEGLTAKPAIARNEDLKIKPEIESKTMEDTSPTPPAPNPETPSAGPEGASRGRKTLEDAAPREGYSATPEETKETLPDAEIAAEAEGPSEATEIAAPADPVKDLPEGEAIADPELDTRITEAQDEAAEAEAAIAAAEAAALELLHAEQGATPDQVDTAQETYDSAVATAELAIRDAEAAQARAEDYARTMYGIELGDMAGRDGYTEDLTAHNLGQRIDDLHGKLSDAQGIVGDEAPAIKPPGFDFEFRPSPRQPEYPQYPNFRDLERDITPHARNVIPM